MRLYGALLLPIPPPGSPSSFQNAAAQQGRDGQCSSARSAARQVLSQALHTGPACRSCTGLLVLMAVLVFSINVDL